jgi:Na+-transporting NADH:ubiquinone oxidoreductase subunit C
MIVFVLVLASVLTAALTAVEALTRPRIARNEQRKLRRNVLAALGVEASPASLDEVFARRVNVAEVNGRTFYVSADGTVAFAIEGAGLWGPIRGILAVDPEGATVKGLAVVHQEETPGLGSRIAEAAYLAGFRSKRLLPRLTITEAGKAKGDNEVDGITGATLSCQAFARILNSEAAACLPLAREVRP